MGAFTPGTQVQPYGTNPNGSLVGNFWSPAASPIVVPPGANTSRRNSTEPAEHSSTSTTNTRLASTCGTFSSSARSVAAWFVSAGYTGTHGTHLFQSRTPLQNNQFVPTSVLANCRQTYITSNASNNPCTANVPNPLQPTTGTSLPFVGTLAQTSIPLVDTYYPYLALLGDTSQGRAHRRRRLAVSRSW